MSAPRRILPVIVLSQFAGTSLWFAGNAVLPGFAISVVSIELFVRLAHSLPLARVLPWLAVGAELGLLALRPLFRQRR